MNPTTILMNEHRVIEQVLTCLEKITDQAAATGAPDQASAEQALDFLRHFADGCHHGKEEQHLFPLLEARGFPRQFGPTGVMRAEHEEGRHHIQAMAAGVRDAAQGQPEALPQFIQHARAYVRLLREHIRKEDHCLFPMASQALNETDQQELLRRFEHVEHDQVGAGVHEEYLALADSLAARFDVPLATSTLAGTHSCCSHGLQKSS
jgi:hemerythrin-like domain-containing protein